ncbi:MAG: hypothetical protein ACM31H_01345 [Nitrososphaerales archaeon]
MIFNHIKCPLHRYTFQVEKIRKWVEQYCVGKVLNLFAGMTYLAVDETRNDIDPAMQAEYHMDAVDFLRMVKAQGGRYHTVILDPPYAYRKSMELYNGHKNSRFKIVKDIIPDILHKNGKVITLGYHSVSMGKQRGFEIESIALFSHGGAIHDTIGTVEIKIK